MSKVTVLASLFLLIGSALGADAAPGQVLTLPEAETRLLANSPRLKALRREALVAWAAAKHAGRLDDPELRLEGMHTLKEADSPWVYGIGLRFELPLNGRLSLERQVGAYRAREARQQVLAAEWDAVGQLRMAWYRWSTSRKQEELLRQYLKRLRPVDAIAVRLAQSGEISRVDQRAFAIERIAREAELTRTETNTLLHLLAIKTLLGLSPEEPVRLKPLTRNNDADALLTLAAAPVDKHPAVEVLRIRRQTALLQARLAKRRVIPDVSLAPAYEREDGADKIGLEIELPVPLWNRNQGERAESEATVSHITAELDWLVYSKRMAWEEARATMSVLRKERDTYLQILRPALNTQMEEIEKLATLGEVQVLLTLEALRTQLENERHFLELELEEASTANRLRQLAGPPHTKESSDHE